MKSDKVGSNKGGSEQRRATAEYTVVVVTQRIR